MNSDSRDKRAARWIDLFAAVCLPLMFHFYRSFDYRTWQRSLLMNKCVHLCDYNVFNRTAKEENGKKGCPALMSWPALPGNQTKHWAETHDNRKWFHCVLPIMCNMGGRVEIHVFCTLVLVTQPGLLALLIWYVHYRSEWQNNNELKQCMLHLMG